VKWFTVKTGTYKTVTPAAAVLSTPVFSLCSPICQEWDLAVGCGHFQPTDQNEIGATGLHHPSVPVIVDDEFFGTPQRILCMPATFEPMEYWNMYSVSVDFICIKEFTWPVLLDFVIFLLQ